MKRNTTIALFYTGVAVICVGIVSISTWLGKGLNAPYRAPAVDMGKETAPQWFPIEKDLAGVNQDNKPVKLSDLRGKVWILNVPSAMANISERSMTSSKVIQISTSLASRLIQKATTSKNSATTGKPLAQIPKTGGSSMPGTRKPLTSISIRHSNSWTSEIASTHWTLRRMANTNTTWHSL